MTKRWRGSVTTHRTCGSAWRSSIARTWPANRNSESSRRWSAAGGRLRGINAKGAAAKYSRRVIDELTEYVKHDFGAKGLAWFRVEDDGKLWSPIAKNFADSWLAELAQRMGAEPGDLLLFVADRWEITCKALHGLRKRLGAELRLYDPKQMHFSWVVEFPMFEYDEELQRWNAMHHPFTSPRDQDYAMLETDPGRCRAKAYDLVINGYEAGGGTIRIHDSQHPAAGLQSAGN